MIISNNNLANTPIANQELSAYPLSNHDIGGILIQLPKESRMRDREVRLTQPALRVLRAFLGASGGLSGAEIAKATQASSGTLYPLLARLEANGWAVSEWEEIDPREAGRPRRRFYSLTALGRTKAREALADLQVPTVVGGLAWSA